MKKLPLRLTTLCLATCLTMTSCATIFGSSSYPITINSNPSGATISITDKAGKQIYKGESPATVELRSSTGYFKKAFYEIKIQSAGYQDQIIPVNFKLDGWYFGNILLGGVIGMLIVDPATGAMYKLKSPDNINVTLNKVETTHTEPTLKIIDINSLTPEVKQQLVLIK